jgi:hypothetical protein
MEAIREFLVELVEYTVFQIVSSFQQFFSGFIAKSISERTGYTATPEKLLSILMERFCGDYEWKN